MFYSSVGSEGETFRPLLWLIMVPTFLGSQHSWLTNSSWNCLLRLRMGFVLLMQFSFLSF